MMCLLDQESYPAPKRGWSASWIMNYIQHQRVDFVPPGLNHIHAMCEADVLIALTTVEYGKDRSTTVVAELFILLSIMLLLHHLPIVFSIRETKRKTQAVEKASVQKSLGHLVAHAITRCHTTSKLLGIGKRHRKTHERRRAKVNNPVADKTIYMLEKMLL
jgi:hypothetical protein